MIENLKEEEKHLLLNIINAFRSSLLDIPPSKGADITNFKNGDRIYKERREQLRSKKDKQRRRKESMS